MSNKSILIGSNGYLGRHLAVELEKHGFENQNFDLQGTSPYHLRNYQKLDITKRDNLEMLNPETGFIFLFAGLTGTAKGFEDYEKFLKVNEMGLLNLLDWMRKTGCRARIVFPSTRLVYKGVKNHDLKEDDPKETKTIYALNKLAAEHLLKMYQNAFGIDFTVFRICVPYGNNIGEGYSYGTLGFFLGKAMKGEDITLFGDGSIRRTFTHVADISGIIIEAVNRQNTTNEIFNIGGENLSLKQAATLVAEKYGVQVKSIDWPEMALKLESDDTVFDDGKIRKFMEISYRRNIASWIKALNN